MKPVANINVNTDSWENLINRVNVIAKALSEEVLTANGSQGITEGNAKLVGNFETDVLVVTDSIRGGNSTTSNTLTVSSRATFTKNTTHQGVSAFQNAATFTVASVSGNLTLNSVVANGSLGTSGQILTSNGSSVYWANSSSGSVVGVYAGVGLTGNVTSNGTISVLANNGIIANSSGLFLDIDFASNNIVANTTLNSNNATYLSGLTWESPGSIGSASANSGSFTTLSVDSSATFSNTVSIGGKATFRTPDATSASINLPQGDSPTSFQNGDLWITTNGFFGRVAGTTVRFSTLTGTETLTNKTINGPTITSPDMSGGTISSTNFNANNVITDSGSISSTSPGFRGIPQNSKTSNYTLALSDAGKHISITSGTVTIPANGTIPFPIGTTIVIFNNSSTTRSLNITTDTLRKAGTTTTGNRTISSYGVASILKVANTVWVVTGNIT